jgi:8-oxo-dGTP pyrophosphatase MutT (NUDIX family)
MIHAHPADRQVYRGLVSVKGVIWRDSAVALLKNERDEWELPGGKLERHETPEACVAREIEEELGLRVTVGPILDAWLYREIVPGADILIITYGCLPDADARIGISDEHQAAGWFALAEMDELRMPEGYRRSVRRWAVDARAITPSPGPSPDVRPSP